MFIYGDYHTHTKFSHGKGSIEDNVLAALSLGLKEIAITDHGFRHGAYHVKRKNWTKMRAETERIKQKYPDINVYLGLETNLIHMDGSIDVEDEDLDSLDILICGYHKYVKSRDFSQYFKFWLPNFGLDLIGKSTKKRRLINTNAYIKCIEKYNIDILSHPLRGLAADIREIAKAAAHYGTYLELNGKNVDMTKEQIHTALEEGAQFILSSDAHKKEKVGDFTTPLEAVKAFEMPLESIANVDKQPVFRSHKASNY